jgi:AraC family cel operon transcriptional repressor
MDIVHFLEKDIIDRETESHYNFLTQVKTLTQIHDHEFYEIFLLVYGSAVHHVNDENVFLQEGSLVFMRPSDVHCYELNDESRCGIINLAFPSGTLSDLFNYLGEGFMPERLLKAKLPPTVTLSNHEKEEAKKRLESLNTLQRNDKQRIRTEVRVLLLEFLTRYFQLRREIRAKQLPAWLEQLNTEMQKKENFTEGLPVMLELSGKSQEHLCRVFKEYFHQTPSHYINELRLNYAANLLTNTDEPIISISLASGFENLSHFYHQFKKKFNMSPSKFRSIHHRSAIVAERIRKPFDF